MLKFSQNLDLFAIFFASQIYGVGAASGGCPMVLTELTHLTESYFDPYSQFTHIDLTVTGRPYSQFLDRRAVDLTVNSVTGVQWTLQSSRSTTDCDRD
jgi:hypothetical protein